MIRLLERKTQRKMWGLKKIAESRAVNEASLKNIRSSVRGRCEPEIKAGGVKSGKRQKDVEAKVISGIVGTGVSYSVVIVEAERLNMGLAVQRAGDGYKKERE